MSEIDEGVVIIDARDIGIGELRPPVDIVELVTTVDV